MKKRVFLIVLDSCGIGEMPDAHKFDDKNCNTLKRISTSDKFNCKNLNKLGLCNIDSIDYLGVNPKPRGAYARLAEKSQGKDTTIGHWEIAGIISPSRLPTYPDGFPKEIIDEFSSKTKRDILCNKPYSGTEVLKDYGQEHVQTGALIVYTSADSVFQIAAHEDIVPPETLYEYCRIARDMLKGEHSVGRVIARPFTGEYPNYVRTSNRHDFSLEPPAKTMLDAIKEQGKEVYAIGKISDIFAGKGITKKVYTKSNSDGIMKISDALKEDFEGLCFINLVDFDSNYGHRQDIDGYANAFAEFDAFLPNITENLYKDDLLIITADHGCDPGDESTDHSREYVPFLMYGENVTPGNLGTRSTFADIAATVCAYLDIDFECDGENLLNDKR